MSSFHIISRSIMSSLFVLSLGFVPYWICRYMSSSISPLGYVFIYLSWICRGVSLPASSGLDKVFCRGCAFLLGYLISFCLLGIMNHFYALIHRYILVSTLWYVEDSPYYECLFLVINHFFALLIVHFSFVCVSLLMVYPNNYARCGRHLVLENPQ